MVQRASNPYDIGAPATDEARTQHHKDQKRKPFRLNSQHNKRGGGRQNQLTDGALTTDGGRPLTKHANRVRVSNSQGGFRRPANKQSHSANPTALAHGGAPGSFSQNQFAANNPEALQAQSRLPSSGYPQASYGQLFDGATSPQSLATGGHQQASAPFYPMSVKPMYQSVPSGGLLKAGGNLSASQKGSRVYQQIIHNNGSGNILFSSTGNVPNV